MRTTSRLTALALGAVLALGVAAPAAAHAAPVPAVPTASCGSPAKCAQQAATNQISAFAAGWRRLGAAVKVDTRTDVVAARIKGAVVEQVSYRGRLTDAQATRAVPASTRTCTTAAACDAWQSIDTIRIQVAYWRAEGLTPRIDRDLNWVVVGEGFDQQWFDYTGALTDKQAARAAGL